MGDRPIIFSAPMIRALLDGRKSQTRRITRLQPFVDEPAICRMIARTSVRFQERDRLWVRETWTPEGDPGPSYRADFAGDTTGWGWKPPIHMPRRASRITLTVTDVRVQRLNEISEEDAIAEGCPAQTDEDLAGADPRGWYRDLWDSLHGAEAWAANPWVCAISFTVERRNIDA